MKIYTARQVSFATFLASPIAGGLLMAHNARAVGQSRQAYRYLGITMTATILVILLAIFVLPERKPGDYLLPLLMAFAMEYWCRKVQGEILAGGRYPEAERASWWVIIGISLLVVLGFAALVFAYAITATIAES